MNTEINILGLGDIHGSDFPNLENLLKKEKIDFILCAGDFPDADKMRDIIFENWVLVKLFGLGIHHIVGIEKYKKLVIESVKSQDKMIKRLGSLETRIISVFGNNDYTRGDVKNYKEFCLNVESLEEKLNSHNNIKLLKQRSLNWKGFNILGFSGTHSYTDDPKLYKKHKKTLEKLFRRSRPEKTIFLTHEPPLGILDRIGMKKSPLYGTHIGNPLYLEMIKKYKPLVHICGHVHEPFGVKRAGITTVINLGSLQDKRYMIIRIKDGRVSVDKRKL